MNNNIRQIISKTVQTILQCVVNKRFPDYILQIFTSELKSMVNAPVQ